MLVKVLKQVGLHCLLLVGVGCQVTSDKCLHLAVKQQLPLHLELLLQKLLLCCLLVAELKHLEIKIKTVTIIMINLIKSKLDDCRKYRNRSPPADGTAGHVGQEQ